MNDLTNRVLHDFMLFGTLNTLKSGFNFDKNCMIFRKLVLYGHNDSKTYRSLIITGYRFLIRINFFQLGVFGNSTVASKKNHPLVYPKMSAIKLLIAAKWLLWGWCRWMTMMTEEMMVTAAAVGNYITMIFNK